MQGAGRHNGADRWLRHRFGRTLGRVRLLGSGLVGARARSCSLAESNQAGVEPYQQAESARRGRQERQPSQVAAVGRFEVLRPTVQAGWASEHQNKLPKQVGMEVASGSSRAARGSGTRNAAWPFGKGNTRHVTRGSWDPVPLSPTSVILERHAERLRGLAGDGPFCGG
jgi:hypothetical protein